MAPCCCLFLKMQTTTSFAFSVTVAVFPLTEAVPPEQDALSNANPVGLAPSVMVYVFGGRSFSSTVFPELFCPGSPLPSVFPEFPLSFRQKLPLASTPALPFAAHATPPALEFCGRFDEKLNFLSTPRGSVCLMTLISPQFEIVRFSIEMSFVVETKLEPDDR